MIGIKGFNMPVDCNICPLCTELYDENEYFCAITEERTLYCEEEDDQDDDNEEFEYVGIGARLPSCPLVEIKEEWNGSVCLFTD